MKKYNLLFASLLFLFPNETIAQERAIIKIDTDRVIDQINPHLYGNFRNIWDKVYMEQKLPPNISSILLPPN